MGIARRKCWLQLGVVVGSLLVMSWATPSKQGGQSKATGQVAATATRQAAGAQEVDWAIFLPEGDGQFQTSVYCSTCHTLEAIVEQRSDEDGMVKTVQRAVFSHGTTTPIEEDDMAAISKYLARSFGPSTPKLELPIHVNTAPKEMLALLGSLSPTDVQNIIDVRTKQPLRDFAALEAVVGKEKLAKLKFAVCFD